MWTLRPRPKANVIPINEQVAATRAQLEREDRILRVAFVWGLAACLALSCIGLALIRLAERRTP